LTGRLLAHSPRHEDIYLQERKYKGGHLLTLYSEVGIPKGYATAF